MREIISRSSGAAREAASQLPSGLFVMSAAFEGRRAGIAIRGVQVCSDEPLLIAVAVRCGHWIEPLIRDSHTFAVWRVDASPQLILKRFAETSRPKLGDPFDGIAHEPLVTGAPIAVSSGLALDCEVVRHVDLEADHELYVGRVLASRVRPRAAETATLVRAAAG